MNILLINHYAGSPRDGMEFRPYYLAREWVRAGHRVQIVAAAYSHVRARQPAMPTRGAALDEVIDGIAYRWLPAPRYTGNGLGRVRNIWAMALGRDLVPLADVLGRTTIVNLNGEHIFMGSVITEEPVKSVLDRFQANCGENPGPFNEILKQFDGTKMLRLRM